MLRQEELSARFAVSVTFSTVWSMAELGYPQPGARTGIVARA